MKPLNFLLFLIIVIKSSFAFADEDFITATIKGLLQEKIQDNRIIIEQEYDSKSKFDKIMQMRDKIDSIVIDQFNALNSSYSAKIILSDKSSETITGKYTSYIMVPVAAKYIKFNDVVQQSDVSALKVRLDNLNKEYATEMQEVVGMQVKQYISAGSMFKISDISRPNVIKNNDPVNIVYTSKSINLKTSGIAMGNGAVGDMVKVKNTTTGTQLLGQIINKNTVQVGGENE